LMIDPLRLTLCSNFANALGFDTPLIQLNDKWSFFAELKKPAIFSFFRNLQLLTFPTIIIQYAVLPSKMARIRIFSLRTPVKVGSNLNSTIVFETGKKAKRARIILLSTAIIQVR